MPAEVTRIGRQTLVLADSAEYLPELPDESISLVVTDPPYGWGFMGKRWDRALPPREIFEHCARLLKPGGRAFVFCGNRGDTHWRMLQLLEHAGFDVGYQELVWVYASGFPKGLNVSKAIDKRLGAQRPIIRVRRCNDIRGGNLVKGHVKHGRYEVTAPATETAARWEGWFGGRQALKPAHEYIIQAVKPVQRSIVDNVLKHGTGALNVEACRIPHNEPCRPLNAQRTGHDFYRQAGRYRDTLELKPEGRLPATVASQLGSPSLRFFDLDAWAERNRLPDDWADLAELGLVWCPKPSRHEKEAGCEQLPKRVPNPNYGKDGYKRPTEGRETCSPCGNFHPTCKPLRVCAYLVMLGCPPGGVVLDPFAGSGTTAVACELLGVEGIHVEIEPDYYAIMCARVRWAERQAGGG